MRCAIPSRLGIHPVLPLIAGVGTHDRDAQEATLLTAAGRLGYGFKTLLHLAPAGPRFQPEDGGDDGLSSLASRLLEQVLRYSCVGLGVAVVELGAIVLAHGLWVDADDTCQLGFGDAVISDCLDLTALGGSMSVPGHCANPLGCRKSSEGCQGRGPLPLTSRGLGPGGCFADARPRLTGGKLGSATYLAISSSCPVAMDSKGLILRLLHSLAGP